MKGVHEHTLTYYHAKQIFRKESVSLVGMLPAVKNASSVSSSMTSYQYQKHAEKTACLVDSHLSTAFFGGTSLSSSGWLVIKKFVVFPEYASEQSQIQQKKTYVTVPFFIDRKTKVLPHFAFTRNVLSLIDEGEHSSVAIFTMWCLEHVHMHARFGECA